MEYALLLPGLALLLAINSDAVIIGTGTKDEYENMLERCCKLGSEWSNTHTTCEGYNEPVAGIPVEHQAICLSTVTICCVGLSRIRSCVAGRETARLGQNCAHLPQITGGEAHKDCCKSCKLGLIASSMKFPCTFTSFKFGYPWDDSYLDCCKNPKGTITHKQVPDGNICGVTDTCEQKCTETSDSNFVCSCSPGFRLNNDKQSCSDINECAEGIHNCTDGKSDCINTLGGYQCYRRIVPTNSQNCPTGFRRNPQTSSCEDIDECVESSHNCDTASSICANSIGGYTCQSKADTKQFCQFGYEFSTIKRGCVDTDECFKGIDSCNKVTEVCINIVGGYTCDRRGGQHCGPGFIPNIVSKKCEDIDECQVTRPCKTSEFCLNTQGSYECYDLAISGCPAGFKPNSAKTSCTDVNECKENLYSCKPFEVCVNSKGSYRCEQHPRCQPGYKFDQTASECIDVDECHENLATCDSDKEDCINLNGSYTCKTVSSSNVSIIQCSSGYKFNRLTSSCKDIDECKDGTNECYGTEDCVNIPGNYECRQKLGKQQICSKGMHLNQTSGLCQDVDECANNNGGCDPKTQICVNTNGGFTCQSTSSPECSTRQVYSSALKRCMFPATFVSKLSNNIIREGDAARFDCLVSGDPPPSIKWYKDGKRNFKAIDEKRALFGGQNDKLIILNSKKSDAGVYSCDADNGVGIITSNATLVIQDECALGTHQCDRQTEDCFSTDIGYECRLKKNVLRSCSVGMELVGSQCIDINECEMGTHNCPNFERCDNTIGSFRCSRIIDCGTGYTWNAFTRRCDDNNECIAGTHDCREGFKCVNIQGSFRCQKVDCPKGFALSSNGMCEYVNCQNGYVADNNGNCVDKDECLGNPCKNHEICTNTIGSYSCRSRLTCGNGYRPNEHGTQCTDINECLEKTDKCTEGQVCLNTPGGYKCQCSPGFRLNRYRKCEDIDECLRYSGKVCAANSVCKNTVGAYECTCKTGFRKSLDGQGCKDIDECKNENMCQHSCLNTWGSYTCKCNSGYELSDDSRTCKDIDECEKWKSKGKLCVGRCVNEPGTYSCSCPRGYILASDKYTCSDINECEQKGVCKGPNQICLNTRGSYKCNTINCPPGYLKSNSNRCKKKSRICNLNDRECIKQPLSYSYNYLTIPSNMALPPRGSLDLFTMRIPKWPRRASRFQLRFVESNGRDPVTKATGAYFRLRNVGLNQAIISLVRKIQGPQEIQLELILRLYNNGVLGGSAVAKIFIAISEHEF